MQISGHPGPEKGPLGRGTLALARRPKTALSFGIPLPCFRSAVQAWVLPVLSRPSGLGTIACSMHQGQARVGGVQVVCMGLLTTCSLV